MAKPYKEGSGWSVRQLYEGQRLYLSGHSSAGAARNAMSQLVNGMKTLGRPKGFGPLKTTLGQAMQDMGLERLPFMKGAEQEARRINRYLRAAGLATLQVTKWTPEFAEQSGQELSATTSSGDTTRTWRSCPNPDDGFERSGVISLAQLSELVWDSQREMFVAPDEATYEFFFEQTTANWARQHLSKKVAFRENTAAQSSKSTLGLYAVTQTGAASPLKTRLIANSWTRAPSRTTNAMCLWRVPGRA